MALVACMTILTGWFSIAIAIYQPDVFDLKIQLPLLLLSSRQNASFYPINYLSIHIQSIRPCYITRLQKQLSSEAIPSVNHHISGSYKKHAFSAHISLACRFSLPLYLVSIFRISLIFRTFGDSPHPREKALNTP